jgi:hypothetical protein
VVAAAAGAGAVAVAALGVHRAGGESAVAVDVEPAAAAVPPTTVAPFAIDADASGLVDATGVDAPASSAEDRREPAPLRTDGAPPDESMPRPTPAPSRQERPARDPSAEDPDPDLRGLLGPRYSAIPTPPPDRSAPAELHVSSIDIGDAPIRPVGLRDDLQLEIPPETDIGWYRFGATAGEAGSTVLVAHVAWNDTPGPFAELGTVEPGDVAEIRLEDGRVRRYEVVERIVYSKLGLPRDVIWRRSGPELLVMITCGGDLQPNSRRFAENIVVYAVPVG